jgi:hypothetical protein
MIVNVSLRLLYVIFDRLLGWLLLLGRTFQRRRAARPAPRGRCTPQNQPGAPPELGRPSLVRRADPTATLSGSNTWTW